ncbi:MAG: glutathionylspermidine synthase family protein [Pseudomonadota bacterium]
MKRIEISERPHWRTLAEEVGFVFHTIDDAPYWNESAYYQFTLQQVEDDLEAPTEELHAMAMDLVPEILRSEEKLIQLDIPHPFWDYIANTWQDRSRHLYGRMDLSYDGSGPAKLLELNYDTPTSLFETGFFQWVWLEELIQTGKLPATADQFNSLQDQLENAFNHLKIPQPFYLASVRDSLEDKGTVSYLMDLAAQCGHEVSYIALEDIGVDGEQFVDTDNRPIHSLFKLYPWEFLIREEFAASIPGSNTSWIEPAWKLLLSNKGILPLLWEKYPDHPNLLPAYFETAATSALDPGWVRKPLFSREGANVEMLTTKREKLSSSGAYADGRFIRQALHALPHYRDSRLQQENYAVIGSWVVVNRAAGIGVREDSTPITRDSSRFVPHIILD